MVFPVTLPRTLRMQLWLHSCFVFLPCTFNGGGALPIPPAPPGGHVIMQSFCWMGDGPNGEGYPRFYHNLKKSLGSWGKLPDGSPKYSVVYMPPPLAACKTQLGFMGPCIEYGGTGYLPVSYTNMSNAYGTEEEQRSMVTSLVDSGIMAMADVVLNHRADWEEPGSFTEPFPGGAKLEEIVADVDPLWTLQGVALDGNDTCGTLCVSVPEPERETSPACQWNRLRKRLGLPEVPNATKDFRSGPDGSDNPTDGSWGSLINRDVTNPSGDQCDLYVGYGGGTNVAGGKPGPDCNELLTYQTMGPCDGPYARMLAHGDKPNENSPVQQEQKALLKRLYDVGYHGFRLDDPKGFCANVLASYVDSLPAGSLTLAELYSPEPDKVAAFTSHYQSTCQDCSPHVSCNENPDWRPAGPVQDFGFYWATYDAFTKMDFSRLTESGRPAGYVGRTPWSAAYSVTWIDDHDTWRGGEGEIQHSGYSNIAQALVYLLAMPGIPMVFFTYDSTVMEGLGYKDSTSKFCARGGSNSPGTSDDVIASSKAKIQPVLNRMLQLRAATNCTWTSADSVYIDPSTSKSFYLSQYRELGGSNWIELVMSTDAKAVETHVANTLAPYPSSNAANVTAPCLDHSLLPPYETDSMIYFAVFASQCPSGALKPFPDRGRTSAGWGGRKLQEQSKLRQVSPILL